MGKVETIVFDLGGVLVELGGMQDMHDQMGSKCNNEKLMAFWQSAQIVKDFGTGKCSTKAFTTHVVKELELPISPRQFLKQFITWPSGLYPGVKALLESLREYYTLVSLSNTNQIHWPIVMKDLGLENCFDHHFPSHLTGLFKPDPSTFENLLSTLGILPKHTLFFDDSAANIAAANKVGIKAIRTIGFGEVKNAIAELALLKHT